MAAPTCTFHLRQDTPHWPLCDRPAVILTSPGGHAGYCLEHALKEGRLAPGYRLVREEEYAELCARAWVDTEAKPTPDDIAWAQDVARNSEGGTP